VCVWTSARIFNSDIPCFYVYCNQGLYSECPIIELVCTLTITLYGSGSLAEVRIFCIPQFSNPLRANYEFGKKDTYTRLWGHIRTFVLYRKVTKFAELVLLATGTIYTDLLENEPLHSKHIFTRQCRSYAP